jgi:hypothetical protein
MKSAVLILLSIMMCSSDGFGLARQDRFVIGCWVDPDFTGAPATDEARLQTLRDAHFNTLTGLNGVGAGDYEVPGKTAAYPSVHYKLDRVSKIAGLRMMMLDRRYSSTPAANAPAVVSSVVNDMKRLSRPEVVMGYTVWDEPSDTTMADANTWIGEFSRQDTARIAWANLVPFNMYRSEFKVGGWNHYVKQVRSYLDNDGSTVASFDYYPFINGKWNTYGCGSSYYFRHLNLFATETNSRKMTFWALPYSSQESSLGYDSISRENLQFEAFAPLAYGAKGLIYYTYARTAGSVSSIVDDSSRTTPVYSWVNGINRQVETIGPLLMRLSWQGTWHESSIDSGYSGSSGEPGLMTLPSSDSTIQSVSSASKSFIVGCFRSGATGYLMIFNKDRTGSHEVKLGFKKSVPIWECNKTTGTWSRLSASATSIALPRVGAVDLRVFRLSNSGAIPTSH